jgi:hypothetical protein
LNALKERAARHEDQLRRRLYPTEGDTDAERREIMKYQETRTQELAEQKKREQERDLSFRGGSSHSGMQHPWSASGYFGGSDTRVSA